MEGWGGLTGSKFIFIREWIIRKGWTYTRDMERTGMVGLGGGTGSKVIFIRKWFIRGGWIIEGICIRQGWRAGEEEREASIYV